MCFSPKMSALFAVLGLTGTIWSANIPALVKSYTPYLLAFYTLMEVLQTLQYRTVNQCEDSENVLLTNFAYVLIIAQPLLWNTIFYLRNKGCNKSVFVLAIILCIVWITWNVSSRLLYDPKKHNEYNKCGVFNRPSTCTKRDGDRHLYWTWTSAYFPDFSANYFMYLCLWFIPGLVIASERLVIILLMLTAIFGYILNGLVGGTILEFPATWCYTSIPFLFITVVQGWLYA